MKILVTGAASGLGLKIADAFCGDSNTVYRFDRAIDRSMDVREAYLHDPKTFFDPRDFGVDLLINCAGVNRNEWFEDVTSRSFNEVMDINCWGQISMTQACLKYLRQSPIKCVINIVSNAAHMPMTSSLAYNCSKAAAKMATAQMAHELTKKHGIIVFSVSPNKLSGTGMSKQIDSEVVRVRGWSEDYAREYQKKALMNGLESDPIDVADFIYNIVHSGQYRFMSGTDIPFGK